MKCYIIAIGVSWKKSKNNSTVELLNDQAWNLNSPSYIVFIVQQPFFINFITRWTQYGIAAKKWILLRSTSSITFDSEKNWDINSCAKFGKSAIREQVDCGCFWYDLTIFMFFAAWILF